MSEDLNFLDELTACFGYPVAENPTVVMVEAAYRHHGLKWRYLTIEVPEDKLEDAVRGVRAMNFAGFNCTIPHKINVIQHLDGLGESASVMGAVNCVVRRGDKLIGENTDGKGFVEGLKKLRDPMGSNVVIFGAGGAARAIGVEVALAGAAKITIVNRSAQRGQELFELLRDHVPAEAAYVLWDGDYDIPAGTDIVINATSIGLFPDVDARLALNTDSLTADMVVADVIPNPPKTRLVRDAQAKGCQVIDGLEMLVNQGVIGIKYWTGVDADPNVMRKSLEDVFGS